MNIQYKYIVDKKDLKNERIVFKVLEKEFIGSYMVFKSKKNTDKTISSYTQENYWLPDKDVNKGDLIVIYTKSGVNNEKKNKDGSTSHFFYWGLTHSLWNNSDDVIVIANMEWKYELAYKE